MNLISSLNLYLSTETKFKMNLMDFFLIFSFVENFRPKCEYTMLYLKQYKSYIKIILFSRYPQTFLSSSKFLNLNALFKISFRDNLFYWNYNESKKGLIIIRWESDLKKYRYACYFQKIIFFNSLRIKVL